MISRHVCVTCDRCGAPAGGTDDLRDDAPAARKRAKELGFIRRDAGEGAPRREDICPTCKIEVSGV